MKLLVLSLLLFIFSGSAYAVSCNEDQSYGTFRLLTDAFLCRSTFSAVKEGAEYCISEESNIESIERVMQGYKFRDVEACVDYNGNVVEIQALN